MEKFDSFENLHLKTEFFEYKPAKITKKDLIKLAMVNAEKMEDFLKQKGLYQEFYDRMIAPDIVANINFDEVFSNATINK